ncbi:MAG: hypothetical protein ACRCZY_11495 [Phocaeicola sp.]
MDRCKNDAFNYFCGNYVKHRGNCVTISALLLLLLSCEFYEKESSYNELPGELDGLRSKQLLEE